MDHASALEVVMRYHERSKHHFHRYAPGPGRLDWANQPDPFRRFEGAVLTGLPLLDQEEEPRSPSYESLFHPGAVLSAPVSLRSVSRLLEYSLALSAWKKAGGARWALRVNPSSGNLHPTEGYVVIDGIPELGEPGVFHYAPREHGLERRVGCSPKVFAQVLHGFPKHAFLFGLSSVYWREAWKYGERAFRYCQHDAGHAIGAVRLAAATLGWQTVVLDGVADATIESLLGLDREADFEGVEREHAELLMALWPRESVVDEVPLFLDPEAVRALAAADWYGRANRLSRDSPIGWEAIDQAAAASRKPTDDRCSITSTPPVRSSSSSEGQPAGEIIRRRRSLLACDGKTAIPAATFYRMLERTLPHAEDAIVWAPAIHFGLFVHRVEGLDPGLYFLVRDFEKLEKLRRSMRADFAWQAPPGCPARLPLYVLERGDARPAATQVSCHQDIAGEGVFSLGMIAAYRETLVAHGPWFYRRLFWEAGAIGQVLYLEAEAAGVRSTGIGCFFDDPVHQTFGFQDLDFQSLYHFTVGGYVDDSRLTTLPPYPIPSDKNQDGPPTAMTE
jgi:SagB-type dehydrogenase family enzyme